MDKENVVYANSGILFSLKKKILTHGTARINFQDIMLSEISQTQKDKHRRIPPTVVKSIEMGGRARGSGGGTEGEWGDAVQWGRSSSFGT